MRMCDLIIKKRNGNELNIEEITYMIDEYVAGKTPDYQMSAMLMAIYFQGMNDRELSDLTNVMAHSGDMVDLSAIDGVRVDKHSTGGVGDKTTLILAPIVAACGVKVAKMTGRGLGFTMGTGDKLEAIPGVRTDYTKEEFCANVNRVGLSVINQSGTIAKADKKIYALRDVTGTVDSPPLIAASIMSKKIAGGSENIVLDVTTGDGAFMKKFDDAVLIAEKMIAIGDHVGRNVVALITNMDTPLGHGIGTILEVKECIETLKGNGPQDLTEVCLALAANMLHLAKKGSIEECTHMAKQVIEDGSAFQKFIDMIECQEGDVAFIRDTSLFAAAPYSKDVFATETGYITRMNTEQCGISSVVLGAGRETKDSEVDYSAGIILEKKRGDYVHKGDKVATVFASDEKKLDEGALLMKTAYYYGTEKPAPEKLILARVSNRGVEDYR